MDILCHVSDKRFGILMPNNDNVIYFSENTFISYFGKFLYLFDKNILVKKYGAMKQSSGSLGFTRMVSPNEHYYFKSKDLGVEWIVHTPIDVEKDCLGVLEHWNHMGGVIGKENFSKRVFEVSMDLMAQEKGSI